MTGKLAHPFISNFGLQNRYNLYKQRGMTQDKIKSIPSYRGVCVYHMLVLALRGALARSSKSADSSHVCRFVACVQRIARSNICKRQVG